MFDQISTIITFENLDVLSIGLAIAATAILGFVTYFRNRSSVTNRAFLQFSLITICWGLVNYFAYTILDPAISFWLLRIVLFFAVWQAFYFFKLFLVFPRESYVFPKIYTFLLQPLVVLTSLFTLTPLVFLKIGQVSDEGQIMQIVNGPGIALFGIIAIGLVLSGFFQLFRKLLHTKQNGRDSLVLMLIGVLLMFGLIIIFNFFLPAFFNFAPLIRLGALFTLPFVILSAVAIIRHGLLNVRLIGSEVFIFLILTLNLLQMVQQRTTGERLLSIGVFVGLVAFGIILIRGVLREITQREELARVASQLEKANVELEKLDKAKSEFLSIASHQLRTPLTATKGYISLVLEGSYGIIPEEAKKRLKNVYEANERLINLINDLLNLSRIESGKIEMQWEDVDVKEITQSIMQELEIKAKEKNLQLKIIAEEPTIHMRADKAKLRNIIMNIVDNAIRYTEKGEITVALKKLPAPAIRIEVSDTGAGMTQEELQHLFQRFSRGEAGTAMWAGGSGLGLNIAKEFAQLHKGKIWAESQGKNKGSSFIIELPLNPTL